MARTMPRWATLALRLARPRRVARLHPSQPGMDRGPRCASVLLAIVLLFIFQNLHRSKIRFMTVSATVPLAVALFAAAACGGLFVLALGSVRIVHLRKVIRRQHRVSTGRPAMSPAPLAGTGWWPRHRPRRATPLPDANNQRGESGTRLHRICPGRLGRRSKDPTGHEVLHARKRPK